MPIEVQVMMFCSLAFIGIRIWANTEWLIWEREHELTLWRVPKTANAGDGKDGMNGIFPI